MSGISTAYPLLGTMTPSKLNTLAPISNYAPSISILSNCLCLAPIAGLQLLLDSQKVFLLSPRILTGQPGFILVQFMLPTELSWLASLI